MEGARAEFLSISRVTQGDYAVILEEGKMNEITDEILLMTISIWCAGFIAAFSVIRILTQEEVNND